MSAKRSLRELRELRKQGKTRAETFELDSATDIYEELSDEKYREHQRARLREDDFVIDDNGDGYVDNGAYEWEQREQWSDDETDSRGPKSKRRKNVGLPTPATDSGKQRNGDVNKMFRKTLSSNLNKAAPTPRLNADSSSLDSLINGLGGSAGSTSSAGSVGSAGSAAAATLKAPRNPLSSARAKLTAMTPQRPGANRFMNPLTTPTPAPRAALRTALPAPRFPTEQLSMDVDEAEEIAEPLVAAPAAAPAQVDQSSTSPPPSSPPPLGANESDDEIELVDLLPGNTSEVVNISSVASSLPTPNVSSDNDPVWTGNSEQNLVEISSDPQQSFTNEQFAPEGLLSFFWMDYSASGSNLVLFGRSGPDTGNESVAVVVQGLYRELYFLPNKDVSHEDLHNEVTELMFSRGMQKVPAKLVSRDYCFGLDDIPAKAEYLLVHVPFSIPESSLQNLQGKTFSHVFGTDATMFERFAVGRNVMGPCWLEVQDVQFAGANTTSAKITAIASAPSKVTVGKKKETAMPPITLMSISLRTKMNKERNRQEIVAISGRFYKNLPHDTIQPPRELPSLLITGVRPVDQVFPAKFTTKLEESQQKMRVKTIYTHKSEKMLLAWFMTQVRRHDPDVIIGHQLENVHLSILLNRMKDLDVYNWNFLGRKINGARKPNRIDTFTLREWIPGRLLTDLSNDMGKSMTVKCDSWTLTEMAKLYLNKDRLDYDIDIEKMAWAQQGADGLISIVRHLEADTLLISELALTIQILALSRQLTVLAGNSWAKTLSGSRVDRNEYLLHHEFTRQGYIVPDRNKGPSAKKSKAKYTGGLVFDPERGLYRSNVLVMDFNSLYPSIIQEFNICFTTVNEWQLNSAEEDLPAIPDRTVEMGIFPKLIQTLVHRRRDVKSLMKNPRITDAERAQYDIRQQALKLTANSMYGCLGYEQSRFYALPLAMLITSKGREILAQTRQLAEKDNLQVVYGDTDSVMINTNVTEYSQALEIGRAFKKKVNEQYRMLEIDIDNVFGALLLHAKKKYAAVNMTEKNGEIVSHVEVKGLDLRRREYSQLSKDASMQALEYILKSDDLDSALNDLHQYLTNLGNEVRAGKIGISKYIIRNKLGKDPSAYPEAEKKRLPHVAVALRQQTKGEIVRADDVMSYVISASEQQVSPADRARTVPELRAEKLEIDFEYYLVHQVLPPLERICANVHGTDKVRLAECLGIDINKHKIKVSVSNEGTVEQRIQPFETTVSDVERFKDAEPLSLQCSCSTSDGPTVFQFRGITDPNLTPQGIKCPECQQIIQGLRLHGQLENQIRKYILRYYNGFVACDDGSCGATTRQIGVFGKKCVGQNGECQGNVSYGYSDRQLFAQLSYFASMFDLTKIKDKDANLILAQQNQDRFEPARKTVNKYLDNNGRRYVDMTSIFRFA